MQLQVGGHDCNLKVHHCEPAFSFVINQCARWFSLGQLVFSPSLITNQDFYFVFSFSIKLNYGGGVLEQISLQ